MSIDISILSRCRSLPELKPGENIALLTTKRLKLPFMEQIKGIACEVLLTPTMGRM